MRNDENLQSGLFDAGSFGTEQERPRQNRKRMAQVRVQSEPRQAVEEKIIWQSKVFAQLQMTNLMLTHLRTDKRTRIVTRWDTFMADLEAYLIRVPAKRPKDFKKFVFNCARRRAKDVLEGKRFPDGRVNLKAFPSQAPPPRKEKSLAAEIAIDDTNALRAKLETLKRGTKEYDETLAQLKKKKETPMLSFGDIIKKIAERQ